MTPRDNRGRFIKGYKLSAEGVERLRKLGLKNKGKIRSQEHKDKISLANKGRLLGKKHPNWKGGRYLTRHGYVFVYTPSHPFSNKMGYVLEHRLIMEKIVDRYLTKNEVVHHINHIPSDNRHQNLILMSKDEHNRQHHIGQRTGVRGVYINSLI